MLEFVIILPGKAEDRSPLAAKETQAGELGSLGGALFARLRDSAHGDVYSSLAFELLLLQENVATGRASPAPGEASSTAAWFPAALPRLVLRLLLYTAFGYF